MVNPRPRSPKEFQEHLQTSLEAIDVNARAYHDGADAGWLAVSTQLYVLLCDRSRGQTLIERTIPSLVLSPLKMEDPKKKKVGYLLHLPGFSTGPDGFQWNLFDHTAAKIPIANWLDQTVAVLSIKENGKNKGVYISLSDIVREGRNQAGGGHFDPEIRDVLQATMGLRVVDKGRDRPFHEKYLVTVGEYVADEIRSQAPS